MLHMPLPVDCQPMTFRRVDAATASRLNADIARVGYRAALRCEWPMSNDCQGYECDRDRWLCDGCRRAMAGAEINRRINARAVPEPEFF